MSTPEGEDRCRFDYRELEKILRGRKLDDDMVEAILGRYSEAWSCSRKPYRDSQRCIFHAEEKDPSVFETAFWSEMKKTEVEGDMFDLTGFVFPETIAFCDERVRPITFNKPVAFSAAIFRGGVSFKGVTFREAMFEAATFKDASFEGAVFKGSATFHASAFQGEVSFEGSTFEGPVSFTDARFEESASFRKGTFGESAFFDATRFKGDVLFTLATFNGTAFFVDTVFQAAAVADYARFEGRVVFNRAIFMIGSFCQATFRDGSFYNCAFLTGGGFYGVKPAYSKTLGFVGSPSEHQTDLDGFWETLSPQQHLEIQDLWGNKLQKLRAVFEKGRMTLKMVRFVNADVEKIEFANVEWGERVSGKWPVRFRRTAVCDELELYKLPLGERNYEEIAQLYRDLRHNYEEDLRYAEAGDFYVGEMEMRRLQVSRSHLGSWGWLRRNVLSLMAWYRNISLYGESHKLVGLWMMGTILAFSLLNINLPTMSSLMQAVDALWKAFTRSFLAFFQVRATEPRDDLERILGAFLSGMLLVALRRKFERRK